MSDDHITAIQGLLKALDEFLESGRTSEAYDQDEPDSEAYAPDEVDWDAVDDGGCGYLKNAVVAVQHYYPRGKLPAPEARIPWRRLQWTCRHESDMFKRQNRAHKDGGKLRDWVEAEITRPAAAV